MVVEPDRVQSGRLCCHRFEPEDEIMPPATGSSRVRRASSKSHDGFKGDREADKDPVKRLGNCSPLWLTVLGLSLTVRMAAVK